MSASLRFAARSDVGLVRQNNEDSAYAGPRVLALADGMGGHAAGEVASQYLVAALAKLDEDQPGSDLTEALSRAMAEGNEAIAAHVAANPDLDGMGCTLTALLVDGHRAGLIHVGDSRAYLLRDGELTQITRDDTFVQSLVDEGKLSADEAHSHPQRSLILKALTGEPVEPTVATRELRVGDRYLLCSDGLSDPVSTDTIRETLSTGTPDETAERLVSLALRSGGPDNVTVVVADVVETRTGAGVEPVVAGAASTEPPQEFAPAADTAAGRAAAFSRSRSTSPGTPDGDDGGAHPPVESAPPRGGRWRFAVPLVGVLAVLAVLGAGSVLLIRSNYLVGEEGNQVVVKRGITGDLFGIKLASVAQVGCLSAEGTLTLHDPDAIPGGCNVLTLGDLREPARETVRSGLPSGSLSEANAQISRLATDNLLPSCSALGSATTVPSRQGESRVPAPTTSGVPTPPPPRDPRATVPPPATPTSATPSTSTSTTPTLSDDENGVPLESPTAASRSVPPVPTSVTSRTPAPGENCRAVN